MGLIGPAISNLAAFSVYNMIRYFFLWKRFRMQPFNAKTVYTLLLAGGCYFIAYLLFKDYQGFLSIVARSIVFVALFVTGTIALKLSPDLQPVLQTVRKRLRI